MSYLISPSLEFRRSLKEIHKTHKSIKIDVEKLGKSLSDNPRQGTLISENMYKVRLAITSKGRGKSGGARVITYIVDEDLTIFLVDIYDKSEQESISENRIKYIIEGLESKDKED
jgi:mRNA-degrading endonuclease RelE of RelBE toxin-antitoxin system